MNPLNSIAQTIILGFILAIIFAIYLGMSPTGFNILGFTVWLHVIFGITWIGLLYYFNFVQTPGLGEAAADKEGPGPQAISKYIAPRALLWFRMAAALTWLTGLSALESAGVGIWGAFSLASPVIGIGAWLGTIMAFNVWFIIWPNQKKVLGLTPAGEDEKAKAKFRAAMASRINVVLSVPMLLSMVIFKHTGMLF